MIVVIFEVTMRDAQSTQEHDRLVEQLKPQLEEMNGFICEEQFQSQAVHNKRLSLSFWRDEVSAQAWKDVAGHAAAQQKGRKDLFAMYRIHVADVVRDYDWRRAEGAAAS